LYNGTDGQAAARDFLIPTLICFQDGLHLN